MNIVKGTRIAVDSGLVAKPLGTWAIAGVQLKFACEAYNFTGTVRHLRGDDPANPTIIRLYVEPDTDTIAPRTRPHGCTCPGHDRLVEVDPDWVTAILAGTIEVL